MTTTVILDLFTPDGMLCGTRTIANQTPTDFALAPDGNPIVATTTDLIKARW